PVGAERILSLTGEQAEFTFVNVPEAPVPSLLRGFSAPVKLRFDYSDAELAHLMAHDSDPFNRWEAGQRLALNVILAGVAAARAGQAFRFPDFLVAAFRRTLRNATGDPAFAAEALGLPSEGFIAEQMEEAAPDEIHAVRVGLRRHLAAALREDFESAYRAFETPGEYSPDAASAGKRALRNACLGYLMELADDSIRATCMRQFETA